MLRQNKNKLFLSLAAILLVAPFAFAFAQAQNQVQNQTAADIINQIAQEQSESTKRAFSARGVYNCEGAQYARVGLPGPAGPFVPVFAQATHSQIQLLTYKECVLDKIASHNANAILAGVVTSYVKLVNENNLIITDWNEYIKKDAQIPAIKRFLKTCKESYKEDSDLCALIAAEKLRQISDDFNRMRCDVSKEDLEKFKNGESLDLQTHMKILFTPACLPYGRYVAAKQTLEDIVAKEIRKAEIEGKDGFRPLKQKRKVKELDLEKSRPGALVFKEVEKELVVTPGSIVAGQLNIALGSGIRKVENADEIDEMVQSFLANLSNRALDAANYGVYGMSRAIDGSPSYTSRLVEQQQKVAAQFRAYAGGLSLANMIENEKNYLSYKQSAVQYIINAIHDLRNYENICFDQKILEGAKEYAAKQAEQAACSSYGSGDQGQDSQQNSCPYTASVSTQILPNFLDIKEKQDGNNIEHGTLVFGGNASQGQGVLEITNANGDIKSEPVTLSDNWSVKLNSDEFPEGNLLAKITYSNGDSYESNFYKESIASVPVVVLPKDRYKIKIEAKSQSSAYNMTLEKNRDNSDIYTGQNGSLTALLKSILKEIETTQKTIEALYKIAADAQNNPELANWKVDQLSAKQLIHTTDAVRKAQEQASAMEARMSELVQNVVKDEWEAQGSGWCNKDKWGNFKVN